MGVTNTLGVTNTHCDYEISEIQRKSLTSSMANVHFLIAL